MMDESHFKLNLIDEVSLVGFSDSTVNDLIHQLKVKVLEDVDLQVVATQPNPPVPAKLARFELVNWERGLQEVLSALSALGLRPATLRETLMAILAKPDVLEAFCILALGYVWASLAGTHLPTLFGGEDSLILTTTVDDGNCGFAGTFLIFACPV